MASQRSQPYFVNWQNLVPKTDISSSFQNTVSSSHCISATSETSKMAVPAFLVGLVAGGAQYGVVKFRLHERDNVVFYALRQLDEDFHGTQSKVCASKTGLEMDAWTWNINMNMNMEYAAQGRRRGKVSGAAFTRTPVLYVSPSRLELDDLCGA